MMKTSIVINRLLLTLFTFLIVSCKQSDDEVYVSPGNIRFKSVVKDSSGDPVEGANVVIWADNKRYTESTNNLGEYDILIPVDELPNTGEIGISIYKSGYRPLPGNYKAPFSDTILYELGNSQSLNECAGCIPILNGNAHELIHLGDDSFGGSINSQFQKATDSEIGVSFRFNPSSASQIRVAFLAKGVQCADDSVYYGNAVYKLTASPSNGDYRLYSFTFTGNPNINSIEVVTSSCSANDMDDWEFVGFHIEEL